MYYNTLLEVSVCASISFIASLTYWLLTASALLTAVAITGSIISVWFNYWLKYLGDLYVLHFGIVLFSILFWPSFDDKEKDFFLLISPCYAKSWILSLIIISPCLMVDFPISSAKLWGEMFWDPTIAFKATEEILLKPICESWIKLDYLAGMEPILFSWLLRATLCFT